MKNIFVVMTVYLISIIVIGCKSDEPSNSSMDVTPPVISITSPANNSTILDSVTIVVSASDNVQVEKVEIYIDGNLIFTRSTIPWQFKWTIDSLGHNSIHTILAKAYDAANNIGSSSTISVTATKTPLPDTTSPNILITSPLNDSTIVDSMLVVASVYDNVAVTKVEFYVDNNVVQTMTSSPWQYNWNVRAYPNKSVHTISAKAYDSANNVGSSTVRSITTKRTEQALQLNGSTDYVRLPSSTSLTSFVNQITVESWIKISAYGTGGIILASGNENEYSLAVHPDGKLGVTMAKVNPQVNAEFVGKTSLSLNTWYHVAFIYNGTTETILINGIVDTSFNTSGNISTSQYAENISIGAYSYNNHSQHNSYFNGIIDEVRIWNLSRSNSDIQSNMNKEIVGNESGLVGYWRFNSNVLDATTNGNNGTIYSNPTFISFVR